MAITAVDLGMGLIKGQTGDTVVKVRWLPTVMTLQAIGLDSRYALIRLVTGFACEVAVIASQTPVIRVVRERSFLCFAMTEIAVIPVVAVRTNSVDFLGASCRRPCVGRMMTVATSLAAMTIGTFQSKSICVIGMVKSNGTALPD